MITPSCLLVASHASIYISLCDFLFTVICNKWLSTFFGWLEQLKNYALNELKCAIRIIRKESSPIPTLRSENLANASTECFSIYHCTNCSFVLTASSGAEWVHRRIIVTQPTRCYKITKISPRNAHSPGWIHSSVDEATRPRIFLLNKCTVASLPGN